MRVYLLQDIVGVGLAGTIVKVSDGYAQNFIFPRKWGVEVTEANEARLVSRIKHEAVKKEQLSTKTSLLAEKIERLELKIACKIHDQDKLYGALSASDIMPLLAAHGVVVSKNQIIFDKAIKSKGSHSFTIKLSNTLKPTCRIKVVPLTTPV
jgi:large subunit ribosomal protein L9